MVENTNRRDVLKATGAAGIAGLIGFSGSGLAQGQRLSWHAGGTGGTYFPLSNEFKTVIEENTDFTIQVQSTGASVENVGSLASGDADFALIQNDVAFFAYNGTSIDAFEGNAVRSLRGVATLYPETIHVVTRPNTNIETLQDLQGATINTGDLGSGTQVNALQILQTVGITQDDFNEQNASFSQAADQLRDGDIDAAFVVGGWPLGAIEELATTSNISIVEISGETRTQITETSPWFAEDTIPAGTYNGVDEDVPTVSVQAMIATREGLSADTVESVTRAIFGSVDQLTIKRDFISEDSALEGMSIPLHSGAERVFGSVTVQTPSDGAGGNETAGNETDTGMAATETTTEN